LEDGERIRQTDERSLGRRGAEKWTQILIEYELNKIMAEWTE
jgi:hypothetical protein